MGKPYSMDLRQRILAYVEAGHSCRAAARVYGVSASTAVRLAVAQRERGDVSPMPQGRAPGTAGKLAPHRAFLLEIVQAEPDMTLKELAGALREAHGVRVQLSSLHRALRRAGHSYKKRADRDKARQG
jgi:transposase